MVVGEGAGGPESPLRCARDDGSEGEARNDESEGEARNDESAGSLR